MNPITVHQDRGAPPSFELDPVAWADSRLATGELETVRAHPPVRYEGPTGDRWRIVRTDGGIEIRPALANGRTREGHNPVVTAILIENRVVVELCSVEGRWTGVFDVDELEIGELGRAMMSAATSRTTTCGCSSAARAANDEVRRRGTSDVAARRRLGHNQ